MVSGCNVVFGLVLRRRVFRKSLANTSRRRAYPHTMAVLLSLVHTTKVVAYHINFLSKAPSEI